MSNNPRLDAVNRYNAKYPDRVQETRRKSDKKRRRKKTLRKYGITEADYDKMLTAQGGVCAICHHSCSMERALSVDHDHTTGRVRGLLCGSCNVGLGRFEDDVLRMESAIRYLNQTAKVGPLS